MCLTNSGFYEKISTPHQTLQECRKTAERITIHSFFQSPLPDSTHASVNLGISSVRRRFVHDMLPNFTRHLSPMPRLHFVTLGIGCPSPSVVSRIRLRLRGTLPHPRILLSFSRVLSTRPGRRIRKHHISSFPATTKRLRQQLAAGESDWSLSALSAFFQVHPQFAPRTPFMSPLTLRQQLRPSRSVTSHPQRPGLSVAHASPKLRHRLFFSFGRGKPSASRSLTPRPVTFCNTPGSLRASVAPSPHAPITFCNT